MPFSEMLPVCKFAHGLDSNPDPQVFTLVCLFGQLWIGCLMLVLLFVYYYIIVYARGRHVWQLRRSSSVQSSSGDDFDANFEVGGVLHFSPLT